MMWLFSKICGNRIRPGVLILAIAVSACGCATTKVSRAIDSRKFNFATDTFAFPNELVWEYFFDENGKWSNRKREPAPDYSHHCFVVAHRAKQFFQHAQFAPEKPIADDDTYRELIDGVISQSDLSDDKVKVVIPGYANLHEFSDAKESLLKAECGGAWRSYFQRGHWRIMMPFTRSQQEVTSEKLMEKLRQNQVVVAHLVRFPQLTINHAVVLFDFHKTRQGIEFAVYDPNKPDKPAKLTFDRASRTFLFPANDYFIGGKVNVYEVYRSCFY